MVSRDIHPVPLHHARWSRSTAEQAVRPAECCTPELLLAGVGGINSPSGNEWQHSYLGIGHGFGEVAHSGDAGSTSAETRSLQVRRDGEARVELGHFVDRHGLDDP